MILSRRRRKQANRTKTRKALRYKSSGYKKYPLTLNRDVEPGDDFYSYVNQSWLEKTKIPPTKSAFGVSEEIEKRIDLRTQILMEKCIRMKDPHTYSDSVQQMLGLLATSVKNADHSNTNETVVRNVLSSIQTLNSKEEVAVIMGEFARYKIRGLFSLYGQYENKNHTNYTYTLGLGSVGLPDPTYYYKKSLRRGMYFQAYKHFLKQVEK